MNASITTLVQLKALVCTSHQFLFGLAGELNVATNSHLSFAVKTNNKLLYISRLNVLFVSLRILLLRPLIIWQAPRAGKMR